VTYRIAGTLPLSVMRELRAKKQWLLNQRTAKPKDEHRREVNKVLFAAYENYLDTQSDVDWLRDPRIASMLRENLYHHDRSLYVLHSYCIMPNHVHVLLTPDPNHFQTKGSSEPPVGESLDKQSPLFRIMHSLKSYTANRANRILNRSGVFWQAESYDHWVRSENELERIVNYIRANPIRAKLVERHEDWYWSSCHDRFLLDGDTSAWLPT